LRAVDVGRRVAGLRHPRVAIATQLPLLRRRVAADERDVIAAVTYPAPGRCVQLAASDSYVTHIETHTRTYQPPPASNVSHLCCMFPLQ